MLEVILLMNDRCVAIGICTDSYNYHALPGLRESGAYGYHSYDCKIYDMTGAWTHSGRVFGTGDEVGCLLTRENGNRFVQFIFEREKLGTTSTRFLVCMKRLANRL